MQQRADEALAYLIRLCGFNNLQTVSKNQTLMSELMLLLSEVKARAISAIRLSPESVESVDYVPRDDDFVPERTDEGQATLDGDDENNKYVDELESFLQENLSNKKYRTAQTLMTNATDGMVQMRSSHLIFKSAQELVKTYKIRNVEFDDAKNRFDNGSSSLSSNLCRDADGNVTFKDNVGVPEFLFGAYLPLDTAVNLMYERVSNIVAQVPGTSLQDALGTSIILGCSDAAEMDSLPKRSKHVTSFSFVPVSLFLIERCAFYLSSIYNILPHQQLNSKELLAHLKFVLKDRFHLWVSIQEKSEFDIMFIDMHDAKFTYCMLQCSAWNRKHHPYCRCSCRRGGGGVAGHVCEMFTAERYRELYKKSEDRMRSQDVLAAINPSGDYTKARHREWVDEYNFGVSHLGIPPSSWDIQSLVFDCFHGRSAYVKLQVAYIRRLFEGNYDSIEKFATFLTSSLRTWSRFHVKPWLNNESNSRLKGENTKEFTRETHRICVQLKTLISNNACEDLCTALYAFEKIHCFLGFVVIDDYQTANAFLNSNMFTSQSNKQEIGEKMIGEFEKLSMQLYSAGMKTYLSDRVLGDRETFYAHALCFYFVQILKRTYKKY